MAKANNGKSFDKGSEEQKEMKHQVMAFLHLNRFDNLKQACEHTGNDYQIIFTQLNGQRICRVRDIEAFVKAIDPKRSIQISHDGLPKIAYKNG